MKRLFLLVLSGFVTLTMYSQNATAKTHYTISGGILGAVNFAEFRTDNSTSASADYDTKAGWGLGGWLNLPVTSHFSLEPQLMYNHLHYVTNSTVTQLLNNGTIGYVSLPVQLKYGGEKFAVVAGPQIDFFAGVKDNNNIAQNSDFKKTAINLFGGVEVLPHGRVTIFARYIFGLTNMDDRANHASAPMEYKNQNIQAGLKLKLFGGKKIVEKTFQATSEVIVIPDTDGDGIKDDVDKCPTVPGLAKYNGCPIPDSDNDGVNDEEDKCPTVPGLAKYNGCPIPDSDNDGINDEEDKCPNVAGVAKYNGCPIPDRDNDGINDELDKCPDIAGTAANNGCPDVPANVSKSLGIEGRNVTFGTGTNAAKITTKSYTALDHVVTLMNENPGLFIRVEGHTDNVGDDNANMKLSEDRANAVKDYLVSKGVSADRVTVQGFGETQPIADNNTKTGRTKNNRVEIRVAY